MILLTSDHLNCHCSAVAISIQFLHETTYHQCVKRAVNSAQWVLHDFDLIFTRFNTPAVSALQKNQLIHLYRADTFVNFTSKESLLHCQHCCFNEEI
jgi:hypothetical protein